MSGRVLGHWFGVQAEITTTKSNEDLSDAGLGKSQMPKN
jgi:hypothetical protein